MTTEPTTEPISSMPYRTIAYLSLGAAFFAQMQEGLILVAAPALAIGILGVVFRRRQAPIAYLLVIALGLMASQFALQRTLRPAVIRPLEVTDVLLCIGVLGYVAAHYRLQSFWSNVLVPDPRRRTGPARRWLTIFGSRPVDLHARPEGHVTQQEVTQLAVSLPVWALVAQAIAVLLASERDLLTLGPRVVQGMIVLWALVLGTVVITTLVRLWQRRRLQRGIALLSLQDIYWHETRGEQRRIERWLAWDRLRRPGS